MSDGAAGIRRPRSCDSSLSDQTTGASRGAFYSGAFS